MPSTPAEGTQQNAADSPAANTPVGDTPKIKATSIVLDRVEGPTSGLRKVTLDGDDVWNKAYLHLLAWSTTAPSEADQMGVDKTDFTVTWEDGETYAGTFGLTRENTDLAAHMLQFLHHLVDKSDYYPHINMEAVEKLLGNYQFGADVPIEL